MSGARLAVKVVVSLSFPRDLHPLHSHQLAWRTTFLPPTGIDPQLAKATVQPAVTKPAARKLLLKPLTFHALHPLAADSVPDKESQTIPTTQEIASRAHLNVKMWVIERGRGGLRRPGIVSV